MNSSTLHNGISNQGKLAPPASQNNRPAPWGLIEAVLLNADLAHCILARCELPCTIFRYGCLNHQTHEILQSYMKSAFSIDRLLLRFFPDPAKFRAIQRSTNTLISGSTALQFFARTLWPESDLDLYLWPGREAMLARYLIDAGYHFSPNKVQRPSFDEEDSTTYYADPRPDQWPVVSWRGFLEITERGSWPDDSEDLSADEDYERNGGPRGLQRVYTFLKDEPNSPGKLLKVQLLVARRSPVEAIFAFHSSTLVLSFRSFLPTDKIIACVMNIISHSTAYSIYPHATYDRRITLYTLYRKQGPLSEAQSRPAVEKYEARGWTVYTYLGDKAEHLFPYGRRWIDDKHSWVIPLPSIPGDQPVSHSDPIDTTSWHLIRKGPTIDFNIVAGLLLDFAYVIDAADEHDTMRTSMRNQNRQYFEAMIEIRKAAARRMFSRKNGCVSVAFSPTYFCHDIIHSHDAQTMEGRPAFGHKKAPVRPYYHSSATFRNHTRLQ
jgi:hypothetical protein